MACASWVVRKPEVAVGVCDWEVLRRAPARCAAACRWRGCGGQRLAAAGGQQGDENQQRERPGEA